MGVPENSPRPSRPPDFLKGDSQAKSLTSIVKRPNIIEPE